MKPSVLILGAAGRLGFCLTRAFAAAGWQVIAQARKPLPADLLSLGDVRPLQCDALDRAALLKGAQGASVVINALNPPYTEWHQLLLPLADAAQATAKALGALLMLPGNVYNFGSELPRLLTAQTPERANTPKAGLRIEMEARMAAEPGLDSVVLRAGDFFGGPGTGSWFDLALTSKLKSGRFIYPGPLDQTHAWAYLPDLAECFVRIAEKRSALSSHHRLHFAGHSVEGQVLQQAFAQAWGQPLKAGDMPWFLIRLGSPFVASWRAIAEMRYLWQKPHQLDDTELRQLIGEPPRTPLLTALRASLEALALVAPNSPVASAEVPA
jgi:nucleoside-diphosphate-sugar epimerase